MTTSDSSAEKSSANPVAQTLGELIERCKDGVKGFTTASTDVEDADLKQIFHQYARERDNNITELQDYLHRTGHTAPETSSLEGTLHRAWIDLTSALVSRERKRVLEECERGEDYAVSAYRNALKNDALPQEVRSLIEKQYQGVQAAHDRIRDLRNQAQGKS